MRFSFLRYLPLALACVACSGTDEGIGTDTTDSGAADTSTKSDSSATTDSATTDSSSTDSTTETSADSTTTETSTDSGSTTTDTAPSETGSFCGGIAGKMCPADQYCFMATGSCMKPDAGGTCQTKPTSCTKELNPVCGCDGKDYGNPCQAAAAGVNIAKSGTCGSSSGGSCGGKLGGTCTKLQYCDYPDAAMCGAFDATGTCKPRPEACIDLFDPVCGCDGKTYSNACVAHSAGVDDASKGACPP